MQNFKADTFELYVIVSDFCNFSCSHCLNSSGPNASRWSIGPEDKQALINSVNSSNKISAVNFSGGEPTLNLSFIRELQSGISRTIHYSMTTNGWFSTRSCDLISTIQLQELLISYDKFHSPFIKKKNLIELASYCKSNDIEVSVNFVFEHIDDLQEAEEFVDRGIKLNPTKLISSGRAADFNPTQTWHDDKVVSRTCPSLEPQQRRNEYEKTIFIPGKGFTPCCGPLAFDNLASDSFLYSPSINDYEGNKLRNVLKRGSFQEQAESIGLNLKKLRFQNACDACRLLNAPIKQDEIPSITNIMNEAKETHYYPCNNKLDEQAADLLGQNFIVGYVYTIGPKDLKVPGSFEQQQTIEVSQSEDNLNELINFIIDNYYVHFSEHYSELAHVNIRAAARNYLSWPTTRFCTYKKEGKIVAALLTNRYDPHPSINLITQHIGYWGYDRKSLSEAEAKWIRADWIQRLSMWSEGVTLIDASIDSFNSTGLNLVKKLGFTQTLLRLDRKPLKP